MEIVISVGQSQMSSISTLMQASSSAAVLLGFSCLAAVADALVRSEDSATLFDPGIFLSPVSEPRKPGGCPWYGGIAMPCSARRPRSPDPAQATARIIAITRAVVELGGRNAN